MSMTDADFTAYQEHLHKSTNAILLDIMRKLDSNGFDLRVAQLAYETWAQNMGIIDAIMCMQGVTQDIRMKSLRENILLGKLVALDAHESLCNECPHKEELVREIQSLS